MSALQLIITNAGRAALVNAAHDGTNAVRIAQAGVSATGFAATPATMAIPGEIKRVATLSGDAVAADTMHLVVRDESTDAYAVRSIGLYLQDGTLFGIHSQVGVIVEKSSQAMMLLAVDVRLQDIAATAITFGDANFLNPPATIDRQGVVELANEAESLGGTDQQRAVTPWGLAKALTARLATWGADVWRASNDGAGSGLDADLLDGVQGIQYVRSDVPTALAANVYFDFSNTSFGAKLRVGGNAYTAAGAMGSLVATDGNLHIDAQTGKGLFLNFFSGKGVTFGGGNQNAVAALSETGAFAATSISAPVIRRNGIPVWGADNDGAGSGLDADLLDGQQGGWYTDIAARLGYAPADRAGDTFSGALQVSGGAGWGLKLSNTNNAQLGYGFVQLGDDAVGANNWHFGSHGDGTFGIYQGKWGAGTARLVVTSLAFTYNGAAIWTAGNDGAGSGLDADLLDGAQGIQYVRSDILTALAANLYFEFTNTTYGSKLRIGGDGYTAAGALGSIATTSGNLHVDAQTGKGLFLNFFSGKGIFFGGGAQATVATLSEAGAFAAASLSAPAITRNGIALWGADNDGSGSGLDADLLDGQQGAWYADIAARLGFTPLNQAAYTAADVRTKLLTVDGAGSGVDADLLDGRHASDFVLQNDATTFGSNANGYWEKRPNGVIEQWGTIAQQINEGVVAITFPIPFTDAASISIGAITVNAAGTDLQDLFVQRVSRTVNGCVVVIQYTGTTTVHSVSGLDWRAIGR